MISSRFDIIFTVLLAQSFYKKPGLVERILGDYQNPQQIFTEPSLLSRLEAGQIDASSGYLSAARSHHLPFVELPDEINLSNPEMEAQWYKTVQFTIRLPSGKETTLRTQPLVFYAAALKDSKEPALAGKFLQFLQSRIFEMQSFQLVLRKECLCYVMTRFGFSSKIFIGTGNNAQQGRFTFTVGAYQGNFVAFFYYCFSMGQNIYSRIFFSDIFQRYHMPA